MFQSATLKKNAIKNPSLVGFGFEVSNFQSANGSNKRMRIIIEVLITDRVALYY
ncbi:hypothetical protein X566_17640 [Afipia sp. P52-10]|nr:hypothetical protein X566_17640 [Afipia sp. P52-10]